MSNKYYTTKDIIELLAGINENTIRNYLCVMRYGRKQIQKKKSRRGNRHYFYKTAPILKLGFDFYRVRAKDVYTESGKCKILEYFNNKYRKELDILPTDDSNHK